MQVRASTLLDQAPRLAGQELNYETCPVCHAGGWHFYVNAHSGLWHCFAGRHNGGSGRVLDHHLLAGSYARIASKDTNKEKAERELTQLPEIVPITKNSLCYQYLSNRNISLDTANQLQLRDWADQFRVFIPFFNQEGKIVQYTGRDYLGTSQRKYLNAVGAPRCLYAPHRAMAGGGPAPAGGHAAPAGVVVLVEGPLDAVAVHQSGGRAVALGGCAIPESLRPAVLAEVRGRRVLVWLDADDAGQRGGAALLRMIEPHADEVVLAPLGWYDSCKDPGSLPPAMLAARLASLDSVFSPREGS